MEQLPREAVLLAAGLGTRMRPITEERPKPLIPVAGETLLARVVANAGDEGVRDFVVNTHYHAQQIADATHDLAKTMPGLHFSISPEPDRLLGTGGGARRAFAQIRAKSAFVFNTDAFWPKGSDRPLARMADMGAAHPGAVVLLCAHPARALGFVERSHDFCLNPLGQVTYDSGLPVIYAGVALMMGGHFDDTPEGPFSLLHIFERALADKALFGVLLNAPWLHVGDPQGLAAAEDFFSARRGPQTAARELSS